MKEIVVISGKGGTGKTSFAAAFAYLAEYETVLGDCDVDASNLALLLPGEEIRKEPFYAGLKAKIDEDECTGCGDCVDVCRFDAVSVPDDIAVVELLSCEGCRACSVVCPADAISFFENRAGTLFERTTECGPMIHAALGIAQDNSGKLVAEVRKQTREIAQKEGVRLALFDGPPGIGCPVHAAIGNVDLVVIVTEPSSSGEHDLMRTLELCEHFSLESTVVINKFDLDEKNSRRMEAVLKEKGVPVAGTIPFSKEVPKALSKGETPLSVPEICDRLKNVFSNIEKSAGLCQ